MYTTGINMVLIYGWVEIRRFKCSVFTHFYVLSAQPSIGMHLPELVQPVLTCFDDPDARVRYYACESLYNISKVARGAVLVFFNSAFDGLCKVSHLLTLFFISFKLSRPSSYLPILHFPSPPLPSSHTTATPLSSFSSFLFLLPFWNFTLKSS